MGACMTPAEMADQDGHVSIPLTEYQSLLRASQWLQCLESAGVDNWEGIHYAYQQMEEEHP